MPTQVKLWQEYSGATLAAPRTLRIAFCVPAITDKHAVRVSDTRLTENEAMRISKLISRLPELVEVERDRNKARSRRKPQPLRFKPVTIGDLIREGKLLEVHCGSCRL